MLEKLESIMNQIEEAQQQLNTLTDQINAIDEQRLIKVISICKKGLVFQRIISNKRIHNCDGNCWHSDQNEFFEYKGFLVAKSDFGEKRSTGYQIEERELWFLDNGMFIETEKTGYQDYYQGSWWSWKREVIEENADPLLWDVDDIVTSILEGLEKRLEKLGERTKAQKGRIEKLKGLQI